MTITQLVEALQLAYMEQGDMPVEMPGHIVVESVVIEPTDQTGRPTVCVLMP